MEVDNNASRMRTSSNATRTRQTSSNSNDERTDATQSSNSQRRHDEQSHHLPQQNQSYGSSMLGSSPHSNSNFNNALSPPRYATRGSLGSVAFSPGGGASSSSSGQSPFIKRRTGSARHNELVLLDHDNNKITGGGSNADIVTSADHSLQLMVNDHDNNQYHQHQEPSPNSNQRQDAKYNDNRHIYSQGDNSHESQQSQNYNQSRVQQPKVDRSSRGTTGMVNDSNLSYGQDGIKYNAYNTANFDMSPEMENLEAQLAEIAPTTPNHSSSLSSFEQKSRSRALSSSSNVAYGDSSGQQGSTSMNLHNITSSSPPSSRRRAAPPAPLDLSPPQPSWMRTKEQHPAVQQHHHQSQQNEAPRQSMSSKTASTSSGGLFLPGINAQASSGSTHAPSGDTLSPVSASTQNTIYSSSTHAQHQQYHQGRGQQQQQSQQGQQSYAGLGLGMPFSHSHTSDSLASVASSSSSSSDMSDMPQRHHQHQHHQYYEHPNSNVDKLASPLSHSGSAMRGVSGSRNSSSSRTMSNNLAGDSSYVYGHANNQDQSSSLASSAASSSYVRKQKSTGDLLSSPEARSPIVDRRGLIGLGELSTPRWTAAIHERRWNQHPIPATVPEGDDHQQLHRQHQHIEDDEHNSHLLDDRDRREKFAASHPEGTGNVPTSAWEGSILGGYMQEKENDHYSTYRKSMPNADSYRSFSDVGLLSGISSSPPTATLPSANLSSPSASSFAAAAASIAAPAATASSVTSSPTALNGQMSNSSSAYSLDALSIPESSSSSSSSSEPGAFYTPSLRYNQQDPLANAGILSSLSSAKINNDEVFKVPKERPPANDSLSSSTTSTILSPTSRAHAQQQHHSGGGSSRNSNRSTTSTSMQGPSSKKGSTPAISSSAIARRNTSEQQRTERDVPSYMRGTTASASKRSSVTSVDEVHKRQYDLPRSPSIPHDVQTLANRTHHSTPPAVHQQHFPQEQSGTTAHSTQAVQTSAVPVRTVRQSASHSRQSSIASNSGSRKGAPLPINTNRSTSDILPTRAHEVRHSAKASSNSPSTIAHNILRHTKGDKYEDFDISAYAQEDAATAEALRKLDGISATSSPRMSRALSTSSFKSAHTGGAGSASDHTPRRTSGGTTLSRQNSKTSTRTTSPHSRPSSSRKSWAKGQAVQSPGLPPAMRDVTDQPVLSPRRKSDDKQAHQYSAQQQYYQAYQHPPNSSSAQHTSRTLSPPMKSPLRGTGTYTNQAAPNSVPHPSITRKLSLTSSSSAPSLAHIDAMQGQTNSGQSLRSPTTSLSPGMPSVHGGAAPAVPPRRGSGIRPPSSGGDMPPTPSLSSKRSSSASLAFGTNTSGSRDSTYATSISAYGSPAQGRTSKSRRGSTSSDVSSVHSGFDGQNRVDRSGGENGDGDQASSRLIPPVPPLPKDWETYRPSTGGEGSLPSSASAASFKERDRPIPGAHLGGSDVKLAQTAVSRSPSMEKPAGPRPLRHVSQPSSLSPASVEPSSLASSPALPSPATESVTSSGLPVDRQADASRTPTKSKWSLSGAFGKNRSPGMSASTSQSSALNTLEKSTSYNDLVGHGHSQQSGLGSKRVSLLSEEFGSNMARRKLASVPDMKALASGERDGALSHGVLPHSESAHQIGRLESNPRPRTESISSSSTTTFATGSSAPALVTTSPGRSRSSLLTPRRTPSGIPFFSRRPSGQSTLGSKPPSTPNSPRSAGFNNAAGEVPSTSSQPEEKTGRRSILGINLFSRSSARKSLSLAKGTGFPASPRLPQEYTSTAPSLTSPRQEVKPEKISEFGVRPSHDSRRSSVSTRASSLIGRKRGKTLPSSTESPVKPEMVNLPPMQMNALPTATMNRLGTLSIDNSPDATVHKGLQIAARTHKPSRAGETLYGKDPLPTITGSPSVAVNLSRDQIDPNGSSSKPATPTKIPRLASSRSNAISPQQSHPVPSPGEEVADSATDLPYRRASLVPGTGMSSSVPQTSSYLKANSKSTTPSSPSTQESPRMPDINAGILTNVDGQDRQRKVSTVSQSTSQAQTLSSSRASGKIPVAVVPPPSEKRRSLLLADARELAKSVRAPLRNSQQAVTGRVLTKAQPAQQEPPSTTSTPSIGITRTRTKTSESVAPPIAKASQLSDGLPTSKSMGSSIASKLSIPTRMSKSATTANLRQSPAPSDHGGRSTSSSRYGTPIGDDEIKGDEEMLEFVQRQRTKQASRGMSPEEIERLFTFPDPIEGSAPLNPQSALQLYRHELSEYELDEILEHKEVFYAGRRDKKKMATRSDATNNYGYDDERGDYQVMEGDHILFRFEIIDTLGKGSFGQVLRCRDHQTGEMVAIKIIRNKKRFHHQALVEIKVLENLKRWDPDEKNCLLKIGDHFTFRGHLCITTELLGINLYELIKANSFRGFSTVLIRRFTVQILAALTLLRHHRVVHCDLKPENILLKHPAKSAIKVIDFGSSCFENEKVYTYIQSRFYRSPEVILGMNYHMAIDMWSLGCILAELYTGMPIFPGENEASQLACIMEVLGVPDKHIVERSSRKKLFFDSTGNPRPTVDSKGRRRRPGAKTLQFALKCDDELFVDFIAKCLTWDPDRRIKPGPALRHPFCAKARGNLATAIPPRSSTTSSRSLLRTSNISTPRRLEKKASDSASVYSTPSTHLHSTLPSTAPVQRMRTQSSAVPSSVGPSSYSGYRAYAR